MRAEGRKNTHKAIRVLYVNTEGSVGGAERSLLLLVEFACAGVEVSAACPAGTLADKLRSRGVKTYTILPAPRKFNNFCAWFCYLFFVNVQIMPVVLRAKPQIIHANGTKAVLAVAAGAGPAEIISDGTTGLLCIKTYESAIKAKRHNRLKLCLLAHESIPDIIFGEISSRL